MDKNNKQCLRKKDYSMSERIFTSPAKYIQGKNAIERIGTELKEVGSQAAVIADEIVWDIAGHQVVDALKKENIESKEILFNGESSEEEINRITEETKGSGATMVIGVCAGKTLVTATAIADLVYAYTVFVPTTARQLFRQVRYLSFIPMKGSSKVIVSTSATRTSFYSILKLSQAHRLVC